MRISATVKGLDKVLDKLDAIDNAHKTKALRDGLGHGGAVAVDEARSIVPVETGDLRDSLHVGGYTSLTPGYREVKRFGELAKPSGSGRNVTVLLGSTLPYAHLVERGTSKVAARPYIRKALDRKNGEILEAVDKGMQKVIDEG